MTRLYSGNMPVAADALPQTVPARRLRVLTALFSFTLFVSASLLFVLEPMVAKSILPKLGGTPMVWNTCVVFFQAVLLVGYLAAHVSTRPGSPIWVRWLYPAIVAAAIAFLPVNFARVPQVDEPPAAWLLGELLRVAALPTVALSMTAPALQSWFSRTQLQGSDDPYFLYAASNAGSLLALLAYPTVIEPTLGLQPQARVWAAGYVVFVCLVGACALVARRFGLRKPREDAPPKPATIGSWQRIRWITLAFIPSSLMLGVTTYISTDIAAVPLIWVFPLALYLATFVIAFGRRSPGAGAAAERRVPLLATVLGVFIVSNARLPIQFDVPLHLAMFTAVAMMCHGRLAAERPPTQYLTEFYVLVSFGGMMGGLFNTLVAPLVFNRVTEYPLVLVCACAVPALYGGWRRGTRVQDVGCAVVTAALAVALNVMLFHNGEASTPARVVAVGVLGLATFTQGRRAPRFAMMLAAMLLASTLTQRAYMRVLESERTFFGSYRVTLEERGKFHALSHGTTLHGLQAVDPSSRGEPLVYYHRLGPFGQAFERLPRLRGGSDIAVIGLGIGSLAAYAGESQQWTFFEIDPAVERVARDQRYFHFLEACGSRCSVVLGDARVSLARSDRHFDAIVLDAFSSDSIPLHLLTREAVNVYLQHLKPGGLLIFHISNRYLRLGPEVARVVEDRGLVAVEQAQQVDAAAIATGRYGSEWVVASADGEAVGLLASDPQWKPLKPPADMRVWTDDYSNIVAVLNLRTR